MRVLSAHMAQTKSVFDSFTNLYSLSKTLRFELVPTTETAESLVKLNLLAHDTKRAENYKKIKPYIDLLHRRFIDESMELAVLHDLDTAFVTYEKYKNATKEQRVELKKEWETTTEKLRKELCDSYVRCATKWIESYPQYKKKNKIEEGEDIDDRKKKPSWNILTQEATLSVLVDTFQKDYPEIVELTKEFKGFYTSLAKLNQTRENIYSDKADATALSHRLINENIAYFFNAILISKRFTSTGIFDECAGKLRADTYAQYLSQKGIDNINTVIADLNSKINIYNQTNSDAKIPHIHRLYKQILSEKSDTGYGGFSW